VGARYRTNFCRVRRAEQALAHAALGPMATTSSEYPISARARAITEGLIRTRRAGHNGVLDQGMLRLECKKGGYYWILLDGGRMLRGAKLFDSEELQPKFRDAMEHAGR